MPDLAALARGLIEASGVGAVVRAALDAEAALVDRLAAAAKAHGVSARSIAKARRAKDRYDQAMSVLALLYPILPNPALLRLVAGREETKKAPTRTTTPRREARKGRRRG